MKIIAKSCTDDIKIDYVIEGLKKISNKDFWFKAFNKIASIDGIINKKAVDDIL